MASQVSSFTDNIALSERALGKGATPERKKRVLVTGGSGKLGRWVVREMAEHGWETYNVDIAPPVKSEEGIAKKFIRADLTDYGQTVSLFTDIDATYRGMDAVIHLSAIPAPGQAPNAAIFHTNILQTYNILEASRVMGVKNIALASSETVFGIPLTPHEPVSFPLTEDIERPESSYSLSKLLGEKMSEQYCRWDPEAKIVNIRLSNVIPPETYENFLTWQDDPFVRAWNGFGYIDPRDCAQAFRLAIESSLKGKHVFNIANADSTYTQPTAELAKKVFPNVPYKQEKHDRESLISIKKAREVLGYEPKYDWQSEVKKLQSAKK